jgi:hypothetical protein
MNRLIAKISAFIGSSFSDVDLLLAPKQNPKSEYRNPKAATKNRNISRKGAKAAKKKIFSELGVLGVLARE